MVSVQAVLDPISSFPIQTYAVFVELTDFTQGARQQVVIAALHLYMSMSTMNPTHSSFEM